MLIKIKSVFNFQPYHNLIFEMVHVISEYHLDVINHSNYYYCSCGKYFKQSIDGKYFDCIYIWNQQHKKTSHRTEPNSIFSPLNDDNDMIMYVIIAQLVELCEINLLSKKKSH